MPVDTDDIRAAVPSLFPDNISGDISAADLRSGMLLVADVIDEETAAREAADLAAAGSIASLGLALDEETDAREAADALGDIIRLTNIGGTANAITADIPAAQAHVAMAVGQPLILSPAATNTATDPTLTVGGVAFVIKTRGGGQVPVGSLANGRRYFGIVWATGGSPVVRVMDVLSVGELAETDSAKIMTAAERTAIAQNTVAIAALSQRADGPAIRPGETLEAWAIWPSDGSGAPDAGTTLVGADGISTPVRDAGRTLTITDRDVTVGPRALLPVIDGHVYRADWLDQRTRAPVDPEGDAVRVRLACLDATYASVGAITLANSNLGAGAPRMLTATFALSTQLGEADFTLPAGTRFVRIVGRTFGTDHVTDIIQAETRDITEAAQITGALDVVAVAAAADRAEAAAVATDADRIATSEDRVAAENAAAAAESARDDAESARDAAQADANVYASTAAGLAAVGEGEQFMVVSGDEIIRYEDVGGVATERARYPTSALVNGLRESVASGAARYDGAGPVYPLATDRDGRVVIGYDVTHESVIAKGLIGGKDASVILAQGDFSGLTGVAPVMTDSTGRVILGYDIDAGRVVAAGISNAPEPTPDALLASPPVTAAVNHIMFYGQSLAVGGGNSPVISATQPYANVTFHGGPRAYTGSAYDFAPLKPLVEDAVNPAPDGNTGRTETPCSGAASYASTLAALENGIEPDSHVILASAPGRGGSKISEIDKGNAWYTDVLLEHVAEAVAINADYACHAVAWIQGENDGLDGTSYASYLADLKQVAVDMDADIRAISGQTSPVYTLTYQTTAYAVSSGNVQRAQMQAAKDSGLIFMVTPIYHLPKTDHLHLTAIGSRWMGAYFGRAYKQLVHDGIAPRCLMPLSATLRDGVIRVRFDVPVRPLALDTILIGLATDYGFRVTDAGGTVAIDSVTIDGDEVVLQLAAAPSGATVVRYGLDYLGVNVDGGIISSGSGNVRDSAPETVKISGEVRNLYNWALHFLLPVISIGE